MYDIVDRFYQQVDWDLIMDQQYQAWEDTHNWGETEPEETVECECGIFWAPDQLDPETGLCPECQARDEIPY